MMQHTTLSRSRRAQSGLYPLARHIKTAKALFKETNRETMLLVAITLLILAFTAISAFS